MSHPDSLQDYERPDESNALEEPHYTNYAEFLMAQPELMICNGERLLEHMESLTHWDEYIERTKA